MIIKSIKLIFLILLSVSVGWILRGYLWDINQSKVIANAPVVNSSPTINKVSPSPYPNREFYQSFLQSKELMKVDPKFQNLTGKGEQAILVSVGEGCASCHYKEIHIFNDKKEIFTFYGDDAVINPIVGLGFSITQPIRKEGEPYCCPTEFESAIFLWNGKTFVKSKTTPNWVDTEQSPG